MARVIGMFTIPVLVLLAVPPSLQRLALALLVPAVSVGLSFGEVDDALSLAWAIVVGALWMTVISLAGRSDLRRCRSRCRR